MEVIENFKKEIANGLVMVDFYAPWCGDCRRIEPILNELNSTIKIHKVNIDENENLSNEFNIRRIPTLIFFKDGKEVGTRLVEPKTKNEILEEINKVK
ncbi:MAG: thioredoxin family protein [Helicobacteraceae bacterium]|nr:thioredoxin family protein [Helicobacteraceae bacterium]